MHMCLLSTIATDGLVLKCPTINIHSADWIFIKLDQSHTQTLHWWEQHLKKKCIFKKKYPDIKGLMIFHWNFPIGKLYNSASNTSHIASLQGCQPVRNFRILYGIYMQNTGVRIWPTKYGNWALSVLSHKVLLPEQSLPVLGCKSVKICGILCLKTFKYLFNHQNIHRVSSGQGKVREIPDLAKVREKSGNFGEGQGKKWMLEKVREKSGNLHLVPHKE